ncbi:MAG: long-chain fatty acid--CoA ligase [Deltaproteobacteria bacterium]|nr:MAG: long-chain fatty acid--CoA ligase [Deltaproteobacteria bacterium]TMB33083.1 MAG: long-chain fatty acid--CoA ligase [Deltaproteobacteria bacterium]
MGARATYSTCAGAATAAGITVRAFFETARRHPRRLNWKHGRASGDGARPRATSAARRALIALGVQRGDAVAIAGPNRPECMMADLGAQGTLQAP